MRNKKKHWIRRIIVNALNITCCQYWSAQKIQYDGNKSPFLFIRNNCFYQRNANNSKSAHNENTQQIWSLFMIFTNVMPIISLARIEALHRILSLPYFSMVQIQLCSPDFKLLLKPYEKPLKIMRGKPRSLSFTSVLYKNPMKLGSF